MTESEKLEEEIAFMTLGITVARESQQFLEQLSVSVRIRKRLMKLLAEETEKENA
jgi:hypothetical protein